MPGIPTPINLNDSIPAPPAGNLNNEWQADSSDPRNVSSYTPLMTGDTGSGGTPGSVPAPASGDAAAGKFFKADGTYQVPAASLTNPMTTEGDIIYGGVSGVPTRLPAGTSGNVLQTNGPAAAPTWVPSSGGGGGGVQPIVRGTTLSGSDLLTVNVALPSGSTAGDLAVLVIGQCAAWNSVSGASVQWYGINSNSSGSNLVGQTLYKILNSSDISNGYVTVVMNNAFDGVYALVVIEGPAGGILPFTGQFITPGAGQSSVVLTSPGVPSKTLGIYFGANRATDTVSIDTGTLIAQLTQTAGGNPVSGALYVDASVPVGGYAVTVSYPTAGSNSYNSVVYIRASGS